MAAAEKVKAIYAICANFGKQRRQQPSPIPDAADVITMEEDDCIPAPRKTTVADLCEKFGFSPTESKVLLERADPLSYFRALPALPTLPTRPVSIFDINLSKYGRWQPQDRLNLDQVPCCLNEGDQRTYDEIGGKKQVWIAGSGKGDDGKRFCTLQLCIRPVKTEGKLYCGQPMPEICFRGQGKVLNKEEKPFYAKCLKNSRCSVRFQPKAWYDDEACLNYATEITPRFTREAKSQGRVSVLFADNLSGQTTRDFIDVLWRKAKTKVRLLPTGVTDLVQLVDAGFGKLVKDEIGQAHDLWCMEGNNIEKWTTGLEMWQKRIHMVKMLMIAYDKACSSYDFEKNARQIGMLMTTDDSDRDDIDIQGIGNVAFTDEDGGSIGEGSVDDEGGHSDDPQQSDDSAEDESESDAEDDTAEVDRSAAEGVGCAVAPKGFSIVDECPNLTNDFEHQELIGKSVLFKWNGTIQAKDFGWYMGKIHSSIKKSLSQRSEMNFNVRYSNKLTNNVLPAQLDKRLNGKNATGNVPHGLYPATYGPGAPYEFHWVLLEKDDAE